MKEGLLSTSTISFLEKKLSQYDKAIRQADCIARTIGIPNQHDALLYKTLPALKQNAALTRETIGRRLSHRQQQLKPWLSQNPKGPYRLIDVSEALGYKGHPDLSVSRLIRQATTGLGLDGNAKFLNIPNGQSVVKLCEDYAILKEQGKRFREREKSRLVAAGASHTQPELPDPLESAIVHLSETAKSILAEPAVNTVTTKFGILEANAYYTFSSFCDEHSSNSVTVAIPPEYLRQWILFVDLQPSGKCTSDCHKRLLRIERYQILK